MEIKFNKQPLRYMRPVLTQVQSQEQTQELKLPEGFPDIGKILGCWGQPIIRSKEWRRTSMSANSGVMAWVMYAPEDGTEPRVVDTWLPFQSRWELPDAVEDGVISVMPLLSDLDARNVSARKIIVRADLDLAGNAMQYSAGMTYTPVETPADVQLLVKHYPMDLPVEAGERQVRIDENFVMPSEKPAIKRIVHFELTPSIQEQKVLSSRLVFRGMCDFSISYLCEDGNMNAWSTQIPFSDYTELSADYDPSATAWIMPVVTALEVDSGEDKQLQLRAAIAAQYTVFDRMMLEVTEDAYSPYRDVTVQTEQLALPILLDKRELEMATSVVVDTDSQEVLDISMRRAHPQLTMDENGMAVRGVGAYQILYRDADGTLSSDTVKYDQTTAFPSADENNVELWPGIIGGSGYTQNGNALTAYASYPVTALSYTSGSIPMVSGLELGEQKQQDADRPSLILRRAGEEDLWTLAKKYGSTVDAIRAANALTEDPEEGVMLLVPVC